MERSPSPLRFGVFEVDFDARELRKRGLRLRLPGKPFEILALLLARPGQVVTREELRRRLWPPGVHVDFDRSLNTAVNRLRDALGDSAETPRFIETLARRGYRFIVPVQPAASSSAAAPPARSIAVLPLEDAAADPAVEYLADGITEGLIGALSQLPELRVVARSTVFRYKGRQVDAQTVGRELNVYAVLAGRLTRDHETLRLSLELVEVNRGWRLWGEQYQRTLPDILALQEEIARVVSHALRLRTARADTTRPARPSTQSTEGWHDYLKGRYHWNKMTEDGLQKAAAHFQQAIQKDPRCAPAYAGLADCYGVSAFFGQTAPKQVLPRVRELALKALDLDGGLAEAHTALAGVLKVHDWNWTAAEAEYRRALELSPNYATGRHLYADFLSATGRSAAALEQIRRAQELDPLSVVISMEVAWNLYIARDYECSLEQSLRTLEMEPAFAPAHQTLALAYEQLGRWMEAITAFQKACALSQRNPVSVAGLGHVLAACGNPHDARQVRDELLARSRRGYVSPYSAALVDAGLGETDQALGALETGFQERDVWMVWINRDPRLDRLRDDPRFAALVRRMGLGADSVGHGRLASRRT